MNKITKKLTKKYKIKVAKLTPEQEEYYAKLNEKLDKALKKHAKKVEWKKPEGLKKMGWFNDQIKTIKKEFSGNPKRVKRMIKQLEYQGWTDMDTWSLDHALARWMVPRLTRFIEVTNGHPCDVTWKQWKLLLRKMLKGFKIIGSDDYWLMTKKQTKAVDEALDIFRKYAFNFWW
jgi:hypothetical protein